MNYTQIVKKFQEERGMFLKKFFLSIDCGLTKIKSVLFDTEGNTVYKNELDTPHNDTKVNAVKIYNAVTELSADMVKSCGAEPQEIVAVSVSGHGNGLYFIGENGMLPYGYSSMYEESKAYTPETNETFPITLQTSWSGQPLPILSQIKHENPNFFGRIRKVLFCKDLIKYILCGRVCTEYTDASAAGLLNYKTGEYDTELMRIYDLDDSMHLLPELTDCTAVIGNISEKFAASTGLSTTTKVLGGLYDVNSCMLGAGVVKPDRYCIIAGTWGINSAVTGDSLALRNITQCTNFCYKDKFMCIDSAPTSCVNLEWFLKNVLKGITYKQADDIVEAQKIEMNLLYFPYIYKSMELSNTGGFSGLYANHDYRDMLRAVFEGIVFDHAYRIEKLRENGIAYDRAVLTGGAANSAVFCQMFSDVLGLKIYTTTQSQSGALGSAIVSSVAVGVYSNVEEAVANMVKMKNYYQPNNNSELKNKYKLFKAELKKR